MGSTAAARPDNGRIAVVIPFYRADAWFPQTIASVLEQTRPADEIVVIDDGTPPGESRSLDGLPRHVHVIRNANIGVGPARQLATEATSASTVAYLDADDWWEPRYLEQVEATLAGMPSAPGAYAAVMKRFPDGRQVAHRDKPAMLDVREMMVRSHVFPSGLVVRRAALDAAGGWNPDRGVLEDWDFVVRLLDCCGPIPLITDALVQYRVGTPNSLNAQHAGVLRRWRRTLAADRTLIERHFGAGAARRRMAQALADRRDRAGGWRGFGYGAAARMLGRPLRESLPR